ncbi:hypothetical protein ASPVEDRAFT_78234 [Aspergillus versicolor CBS 583.65]|uniref:D-xylose reductase [NAD(P)H] n=1 Tax=Aspergillus versicolor CBS 583.65 TaxID=1036611 RepID=A0A1L9P4T9_ASPVE|nr:uncharacterized protein ASPVEDRAFT_78234 [Aspergillus versicolor CBS 583.65]OJI96464.1 hypothetical protein ASPVEDRAFT_78234 [Aspergillus versicolor CBS 583.65]
MDYLDLYLMHWPVSTSSKGFAIELNNWNFINTWEEMQKVPSHKVHNIGVSNFGIANLQRLLHHPSCKVVPAVNQIELHPYWPSWRILKYCKNHGIHCTAYSCLGSTGSPLFDNPVVLELSQSKGKSPQQILIMWGIQRDTSVVPKTVTPVRIKENSELDGWGLSNHEMDLLNGCTIRFKSCNGMWLRGKIFFEDGD